MTTYKITVQPNTSLQYTDVCPLCKEQFVMGAIEYLFEIDGVTLGTICPRCIISGPTGAAERAREHATFLRNMANAIDEGANEFQNIPADVFPAAVEETMKIASQQERGRLQ